MILIILCYVFKENSLTEIGPIDNNQVDVKLKTLDRLGIKLFN